MKKPSKASTNFVIPVKLLAMSDMSNEHSKAYRLVKIFNSHTNKWKRVIIAASEIDDFRLLRKKLVDAGLPLDLDKKQWEEIDMLLRKTPEKRFLISSIDFTDVKYSANAVPITGQQILAASSTCFKSKSVARRKGGHQRVKASQHSVD